MPESTRSSRTADPTGPGRLWIVVLAGGVGSRFWPLSTPARPKQLLPLAGPSPLVADCLDRARALAPDERIRIVAGAHLVPLLREAVGDLPDACFLTEPRARGTAPALAWAAHEIAAADPDAVMISLHSDHAIRPLDAFTDVVRKAAGVARRQDALVTVGARPSRPETGYGYIRPGALLDAADPEGGRQVASFHEKPDEGTARRYVEEGRLWNTGIFAWTVGRFLAELEAHAPDVARHLPTIDRAGATAFFDAVPSASVDRAVLERTARAAVVPATFAWDDIGAWHALPRAREGDEGDNVLVGDVHVHEGTGNVAWAEEGTLVLFGVDDVVVVRSGDVTLVTRRDRAADLKALLERLPEDLRKRP